MSPSRVKNAIWLMRATRPACSLYARLDRLHVVVREPEMMADLMHQDVRDDGAEHFVMLGPVVQDRAAVEPDHVRHLHRRAFRAERQAYAMEQPHEVERAFDVHAVEHL